MCDTDSVDVRRILTVFSLQQLLEVLLRFLLHYGLAGADVWKRTFSSAQQPRSCYWNSSVRRCETHAGWAADVPALTLSVPPTQTSSSALCPSRDASAASAEEINCRLSVTSQSLGSVKYSYSHRMQPGGSWLFDSESQRRWKNARFWFHWRPTQEFRRTFSWGRDDKWPSAADELTLSWEFSMTLMPLSEEVTSGPNSTHPAEHKLLSDFFIVCRVNLFCFKTK